MTKRVKTGGRAAGTPNKATANFREAIARFVDGNSERLQQWLDEIYENDGPKAAWDCMVDVIEYHAPKLARTELTGPNGGAMRIVVDRWGKRDDLPPEQLEAQRVSVESLGLPVRRGA